MAKPPPLARQQRSVDAAFWEEERTTTIFACKVRIAAALPVAAWVWGQNGLYEGLYYLVLISLFAVSGVALIWLVRHGDYAAWMKYAIAAIDAILLAYILLAPNPLDATPLPAPMMLRFGNFVYAFLLLLFTVFSFSPWLVLWTGAWLAASGSAVAFWVATRPGAVTWGKVGLKNPSIDEFMRIYLQPEFVALDSFYRDVVVIMVAAGILAAAVWRSRRLIQRQVMLARERASLARYFSPNVVDELSHGGSSIGEGREQNVGVLFADISGFTHMCEELSTRESLKMLRDFHRYAERAIFSNGGTIDKFIGDAVMATFGTPHPGDRDASNTLQCARDLVRLLHEWNAERSRRGEPEVGVAIGAHYGLCMVGDIGGESRLEFTVIGDTVNLASRLEEMCHQLKADVVISDDLYDAARDEGSSDALDGFIESAPLVVRGRERPVIMWSWTRERDDD
jgi:adenylate cyclase